MRRAETPKPPRSRPPLVLLAVVAALASLPHPAPAAETAAAPPIANLDFSQGEIGQAPPSWHLPQPTQAAGYTATTVAADDVPGKRAALLEHAAAAGSAATAKPGSFGTLMRSIDAAPY